MNQKAAGGCPPPFKAADKGMTLCAESVFKKKMREENPAVYS